MIKRIICFVVITVLVFSFPLNTYASIDSKAYILTSGEAMHLTFRGNDYFKITLHKDATLKLDIETYDSELVYLYIFDVYENDYIATSYSASLGEFRNVNGPLYYAQYNNVTGAFDGTITYKLKQGTYYLNTDTLQPYYTTDGLIKATIIYPPKGDVDMNGAVNALDAAKILQNIIFYIEMDDTADFNSDGSINALDASAILRYVVER